MASLQKPKPYLDPQAHAFQEPEPGTVEDPRHEGVRPSLCAKTARISASVKTAGTRAGRFARSTLSSHFELLPEDLFLDDTIALSA